jgi:hypothetical protein
MYVAVPKVEIIVVISFFIVEAGLKTKMTCNYGLQVIFDQVFNFTTRKFGRCPAGISAGQD